MQWLKQIYLYRFLYLKDSVNYLKEMDNLKNGKFFPCFYSYINWAEVLTNVPPSSTSYTNCQRGWHQSEIENNLVTVSYIFLFLFLDPLFLTSSLLHGESSRFLKI